MRLLLASVLWVLGACGTDTAVEPGLTAQGPGGPSLGQPDTGAGDLDTRTEPDGGPVRPDGRSERDLGADPDRPDASLDGASADDLPGQADAEDAGPEADAPDPVVAPELDAAGIAEVCGSYCDQLVARCGLPDVDQCIDDCKGLLGIDPWYLANYACARVSCDYDACFGTGAALEPAAECIDLCVAAGECEAWDMLNLPEGLVGVCQASCSGSVVGNPNASPAFQCVTNALEAGCDEATATACLTPDVCGAVCEVSLTPPEPDQDPNPNFCAADSPLAQAWGDAEACVAACAAAESSTTYAGCVLGLGCEDPELCDDPAPAVPACAATCDALSSACGGPVGGLPNAQVCTAYCDGLAQGIQLEDTLSATEAEACVEALGQCPPGPQLYFRILSCLVPAQAPCETFCGGLDGCGYLGMSTSYADCVASCSVDLVVNEADYGPQSACIEAADGDCAAIAACVSD